MKRILILGGTLFVGRRFVEQCLAEGTMQLSLFHRGKTNPELFPECEKIIGNRESDDIDIVAQRDWDAVVDFSGYYPNSMQRLLSLLKGRVDRYVFISSLSVFSFEHAAEGVVYNESEQILPCSAAERVDTSMMSYGARKAECERVLEQAHWLKGISLRPAIIYGRYDWSERLYSWLYRLATRNELVLPNGGSDLISMSDLEDLCGLVRASLDIVNPLAAYNATTHEAVPFSTVLNFMAEQLKRHPTYVEADWQRLEELGAHAGSDFPMLFGMDMNIDNLAILRDSAYRCRSLEESLTEFVQLFSHRTLSVPKVGLDREKEDGLIGNLRT